MVATREGTASAVPGFDVYAVLWQRSEAQSEPSSDAVIAACWDCYPELIRQAEGYIRQYVRKPRHTDPLYFGVEATSPIGMSPLTEAFDLVHSLYVSIIPKLAGRTIEGDMLGYMRTSLKYHWFAVSRKGTNRPRATAIDTLPIQLPQRETISALVREIEYEARKRMIEDALAALPDRERIAVSLYHVKKAKREQIARELGVSVRQVARYLWIGEARLCEALLPLIVG